MSNEMEEAIKTGTARVHQIRKERFQRILADYEAEGPDSSVPGCSKFGNLMFPDLWAHYALVVQGDGGRFFVLCCEGRKDVEHVAALQVQDGWQPICYYDLDELAGPEQDPCEGDVVEYEDKRYYVVHVSDDVQYGEIYHELYLHESSPEPDGWINVCEKVDEYRCKIVERVNPDERKPVRYLVAGVRTVVVFNTEAAPA